jgi:hypothetical protein
MKLNIMTLYLMLWTTFKGKRVNGRICFINDVVIISNPNGSAVVIPADGSYIRVFNKTWQIE